MAALMAVYTQVSTQEVAALITHLGLGHVTALQGIRGGVENTNYFLDTRLDTPGKESIESRHVLTVFERLSAAELPFYLGLMQHLAQRGLPVPCPKADAHGNILHTIQGKPAALVDRLPGHHQLQPTAAHCASLGSMLARMHVAGSDFALAQPNPRGLAWWTNTAPRLTPFVTIAQRTLIAQELQFQQQQAASYNVLPCGPIHADLFRDNVLFDSDGAISGLFDFYFAGHDTYLFDVAVCLNDWCIHPPTGELDEPRAHHLLRAYNTVRPLTAAEQQLLPSQLRAAALRFWLSRLLDVHLPRNAALLQAHDPTHFERILRLRSTHVFPNFKLS
jgi:homoserine kinase type II